MYFCLRHNSLGLILLVIGTQAQSNCEEAATCRDCIGLSGDCIWCADPLFDVPRCMTTDHIDTECPLQYLENPRGRIVSLTPMQTGSMEQFTPVSANLELRVGEPQGFQVNVTPTANYPLDIYILMDLSFSMTPYLNNLRDVAVALASTLNNITRNFKIGFGAFNEKPISPFIGFLPRTFPLWTDYSFRHIVSLTSNVTVFSQGIAHLETVTNNDSPEALLEGMLQAVVCKEVIGWREEARKLILAFTDQYYHIAGDGKFAGSFRPSDGNCHVTHESSTGQLDYTMWRRFDYPSIGQLRAKLQENDIIPIFASVSELSHVYMDLVQLIPGSIFQTMGDRLSNGILVDSSVILTIIRDSYDATSQRIELLPVTGNENFMFTITPTCPFNSARDGSACNDVQIGRTALFNVTVTLTQCPAQLQTIPIRIVGFGMVSLTLSGVCSCPCEAETEFNSTMCSGQGDYTCTVCECHQSFGERCECESPESLSLPCPVGLTRNMFCSSRGTCECGVCLCHQPSASVVPEEIQNATYYGTGCECDNFSCPKGTDNLVCSGKGECQCNQLCYCSISPTSLMPYRGESCQCPPLEEVCINPADGLICSGRGQCPCDECQCELGYKGEYCNITRNLDIQSCDGTACAECAANVAPPQTDCSELNCSVVSIDPEEDEEYFIDGTLAIRCDFIDSGNCLRVYYTIGGTAPIHAEKADCRGLPIPVWSIVVIVIGSLLLLAFCLLVFIKCTIVCLDRYELYRWEKERVYFENDINENPTYINPEQKYQNVAYGLEINEPTIR